VDFRPGQLVGILIAVIAVVVLAIVGITRPGTPAAGTQATSSPKIIAVSGQAKISVRPDIVYLNLGVVSEAATAKAAGQANAESMSKVVGALKSFGIPKDSIKTSNYRVEPIYKHDPKGASPPVITGYRVFNTVNISTQLLEKMGQIIDECLTNGANNVEGIRFALKDEETQVLAAVEKAVTNARNKADAAARAAGVRIKGVRSVRIDHSPPPPRYMGYEKALSATGGGVSTPIEPGEIEILVTVAVEYDL
jgi:uncharacterized protein YggE